MTLNFVCADPMFLCYDEPATEDSFDLDAPSEENTDIAIDLGEPTDTGSTDVEEDVVITQKPAVTFTQEQVNKFLAEDRRKRETKVKSQQEQFKKMETRLQQLIAANETTKEQKSLLEVDLEDLRASQRTEQEQREHLAKQAKEKHDNEIAGLKASAEKWESLYRTSMIQRSLLDAAAQHDAFNPEDIIDKLEKHTELRQDKDSDGNLLGSFSPRTAVKVKDPETGDTLTAWKSPAEAVELMKANPDKHGNLFRSSIMAGIGGGTATSPGSVSAPVDGKDLDIDDWMKIAREDPEKLGLPARRR